MVRFAILSEHELCEETATVANPDGHNSHLNVEQLAKTLTSLRHMYDDHAQRGISPGEPGAEAEMFAYQLLLRIDSHGRYNVERREMLNDLRSAHLKVLLSPAGAYTRSHFRSIGLTLPLSAQLLSLLCPPYNPN